MVNRKKLTTKQRLQDKLKKQQKKETKTNIEYLEEIHQYLPPQTPVQMSARLACIEQHKNIKEPHCEICGDTEEDGKLFGIPTETIPSLKYYRFMCEFCYKVQTKM